MAQHIGSTAPIGVFDSGVGGLSVVQSLQKLLPAENIIYIADSAYAPYGQQQVATICARADWITQQLLNMGAKCVLVACNTATVNTIASLRAKFNLPIIGVEPGIKPAILQSNNKRIGVIATNQTVQSANFAKLLARFADSAHIGVQACPGLVECIEAGELDGHKIVTLLAQYLQPLITDNIDQLVLGCTHYIFIEASIRAVLAKLTDRQIMLLSTQDAVAKECKRRLLELGLDNIHHAGSLQCFTTGDSATARKIFSTLLGFECCVNKL